MKTTRATVDWLPSNHEALFDQGSQTWDYLIDPANRDRMGFAITTPQGAWIDGVFHPKYFAFITAFNDWRNPATRTPIKTEDLLAAEGPFKDMYRQLYTGFLRNSPFVTDSDLVAMGLPERHTGGGKPAPAPTTYVEVTVTPVGPGVIDLHFRDKDSDHKSKPAGVHGAEIVWAILDDPPAGWEALAHSSFDTHTPLRLSFLNEQRGKTLYFAARWENTRGEKGPWSEIMSAIIP
ncbi:MAG: hypothetical protein LBT49_03085 [Prevotellaceae bacterium]|jgi:hypothetical protein|nr:hypothetical protein [Prevotellaceae bacterium]